MSDALWDRASLMTVISAKALLTVIAAQAGTHARMHALATSVGCSIDDAPLLSAQRGEETAFGLLCAIAFPNDAAHKCGGYTP